MIFDAHLHLKQLFAFDKQPFDFIGENEYKALFSTSSLDEIEFVEKFKIQNPKLAKSFFISFGVHPQNPDPAGIKILENLIDENRVDAIGEIGLDRFSEKFKSNFDLQTELFERQLEIAEKHALPVILHVRKSMREIFALKNRLKKSPKVIFHSYSGTAEEAETLLKQGINAFFSFGTSILNGHKKAVRALSELPIESILSETDAPYQPLKNQLFTKASDILPVRAKIAEIKGVKMAN